MSKMYRGERQQQFKKLAEMKWKAVLKKNPSTRQFFESIKLSNHEKEWVVNGNFEKTYGDYCFPNYQDRLLSVHQNDEGLIMVAFKKDNDICHQLLNKLQHTNTIKDLDHGFVAGSRKSEEIDVILNALQEVIAS